MASVVGIDLGFQNSLIAAAGRGGVDVILNGNSQRLNPYVYEYRPSYVHSFVMRFSLSVLTLFIDFFLSAAFLYLLRPRNDD